MALADLGTSLERPSGSHWSTRLKRLPPACEFTAGRRRGVNRRE
jgi:hypothetical protein